MEAPKSLSDRKAAAKLAIEGLEKEYGKGIVSQFGSKEHQAWPHIPTGIYEIDYDVLGIGGIPRGRITELFGPEAGGKSTLALMIVATAQAEGGLAAYIDAEHALDPKWAAGLGVNMNDLYICQPNNGEEALEVAEALIQTGVFSIVVIDSVAALVPKAELEGDMGDSNMGLQARLMSQAMRKLTAKVSTSNTALVFINQIREKIGVMFGSPETTTGGRALKFYASVRLDVRRVQAIKSGDKVVGNIVRVKGAKNKLSPPYREAEVEFDFVCGYDRYASLVNAAVIANVIEKSGAWFSYNGKKLGQGKDAAKQALVSDTKLYNEVLENVTNSRREKDTSKVA